MFSDIKNILPTTPAPDAKAQQTDTRQEILRHDPEQERQKKNKQSKDDGGGLFGDDLTEVSVDMLEVFLHQVLENYTGQDASEQNAASGQEDINIDTAAMEDPANVKPNAKAIGAYARTASYTSHDVPHPAPTESVSAPHLSSADMQLVYQMQKDIKLLKERGITAISIIQGAPDEGFLQTIHNGMKRALI